MDTKPKCHTCTIKSSENESSHFSEDGLIKPCQNCEYVYHESCLERYIDENLRCIGCDKPIITIEKQIINTNFICTKSTNIFVYLTLFFGYFSVIEIIIGNTDHQIHYLHNINLHVGVSILFHFIIYCASIDYVFSLDIIFDKNINAYENMEKYLWLPLINYSNCKYIWATCLLIALNHIYIYCFHVIGFIITYCEDQQEKMFVPRTYYRCARFLIIVTFVYKVFHYIYTACLTKKRIYTTNTNLSI